MSSLHTIMTGTVQALGPLFLAAAAYQIAKVYPVTKQKDPNASRVVSTVIVYGRALAICAFVALGLALTHGTHMEDSDPLFGGGEEVTDFEVSPQEREQYGWKVFAALAVGAISGTRRALKASASSTNITPPGWND